MDFLPAHIPCDGIYNPLIQNKELNLKLLRLDTIHPIVSGNKWFKLKYNLLKSQEQGAKGILTFGGAYSNHIVATAYACKTRGIPCIGVIRGHELTAKSNPSLQFAAEQGMKLHFVSRELYSQKKELNAVLQKEFPEYYIVPEGGSNSEGFTGAKEISNYIPNETEYIVCDCGTGVTAAGVTASLKPHQKILVLPVLKGADGILNDIGRWVQNDALMQNQLFWINQFHFGGYGKFNNDLLNFIRGFHKTTGIGLDPIYTGKLMYGVMKLIEEDYFPKSSRIVAIHSGGLQGAEHLGLFD